MSLDGIGLFTGLKGRLDYLNKSQTLIAQNIANADTPDYQAQGLREVDFSSVLESSLNVSSRRSSTNSLRSIQPLATNPAHINASTGMRQVRDGEQEMVVETSPAGNSVDLEEQILNASQVSGSYDLTLNIMRKNVQLIRTAIVGNSR